MRVATRNTLYAGGLFAVAAVGVLYFAVDPGTAVWMPKCMIHVVTGYDCPGCGSQRAVHALLHGEIAQAFRANALFVIMLPLLMLMLISELFKKRLKTLNRILCNFKVAYSILGVVVLWGILRNLLL